MQSIKAELDKKFQESLKEIETYRSENTGLDSMLNVKVRELTAKKRKWMPY